MFMLIRLAMFVTNMNMSLRRMSAIVALPVKINTLHTTM